jgi:hypothetical protein
MVAADVATQAELDAVSAAALAAAAQKLVGDVVQVVRTQTGAMATGTGTIPLDDTIPQISEGTEFMTAAITPAAASNLLQIDVVFNGSNSAGAGTMIVALFRDATTDALACAAQVMANSGVLTHVRFLHRVTAGSTAATTFRVRAGFSTAATVTFNGSLGARLFGGVMSSSITVTEIRA